MKLSGDEGAILAEPVDYYWLLFAMWCGENGRTAGDTESIKTKLESLQSLNYYEIEK